MATGTAGTTARKFHQDLVHYIVAPIVYTKAGVTTIGKLPKGAAVIGGGVVVTTPFAGGTPQTLDVGISGDTSDFASALVLTAAGNIVFDDMASASKAYMSADTDIIATLSAGATVSAGAGYVHVEYIMANRLP
jgi:hypothetical protein